METAPHFAKTPRVLCVDDEESAHTYLEAVMAAQGYEVVKAYNGREALKILATERIDLVLLDIMMPDMDGYEVCRRIKADRALSHIPVVMLTGVMSKDARIKSIEAGAEDFLQKMQNHEEVAARVRMLLRVKDLNDRLAQSLENIKDLTSYGERVIRGFDPLRFDFLENVDGTVRRLIRKTADALDKPLIIIVGVTEGPRRRWFQYEFVFGELVRMDIPLERDVDLAALLGRDDSRTVFFNGGGSRDEWPRQLKRIETINIDIVNAVAYLSEDLCLLAVNYGREVTPYDALVVENLAVQSRFLRSLASQVKEVDEVFVYTVHALARAAEANDEDTGRHIIRVGEYSAVLAERMGLDGAFVSAIRLQATLHDVGKIYISPEILRKKGKLTPQEWIEIKKHPLFGAKIIGPHPRFRMAHVIALNHHERWDGTGYPRGLMGEAIPIEARIVNLADQYDTLRIPRWHKPALDHVTASRILNKGDDRTSPSHFDPKVLRAFRETAFLFEEIYERLKDPARARGTG